MKTSVLVWVVLALAACGKNEHAFARFLEDAQPAPHDAPPPPVDAATLSLAQVVAEAKARDLNSAFMQLTRTGAETGSLAS